MGLAQARPNDMVECDVCVCVCVCVWGGGGGGGWYHLKCVSLYSNVQQKANNGTVINVSSVCCIVT